jgi:hypothetical protein
MYVVGSGFHSRLSRVLALSAVLSGACGGGEGEAFVDVGMPRDAMDKGGETHMADPRRACETVEMDGEFVVEHEQDFTGRFSMGEPYTKTVMLFGGEPVQEVNVLSSAYIFGLDKVDAQMLAKKYPDFANCSSPGGQEASRYIVPYDLVPASCEVYDQIVDALRVYHENAVAGGDRTSLRFEGAPLELESVTADATGEDVTDQVKDQDFHLVTSVEQLTGQSVVSFGVNP